MIYTDGVHLVADKLQELHDYASRAGIAKCWYEKTKKHPYYDIPQKRLRTVLYHIDVKMVKRVGIRTILVKSKEMK